MRAGWLAFALILLSSCSPPQMFRVEVDEPVTRATLTLNGASAGMMKNVDGAYWAKWNGSDASGKIDIVFPDGGIVSCKIGYVTSGLTEVRTFVMRGRKCEPRPDMR